MLTSVRKGVLVEHLFVLVGLLDIDSNKFDVLICFKQSLQSSLFTSAEADYHINNLSLTPRKVNDYGEVVARKITQECKYLNDEEIQLVMKGYESGRNTYQLAKEFGCHRVTISNTLKKNGIQPTIRKDDKLDTENIIAMYKDKYTVKAIAEKYEISPYIISRCLKSNGIEIKGRWG